MWISFQNALLKILHKYPDVQFDSVIDFFKQNFYLKLLVCEKCIDFCVAITDREITVLLIVLKINSTTVCK